ncbi:hypothetical protein [Marinibacterium profundimaris]|uniref:STAS/SEC14 domain-containing protein n=1 Tax=Marinibacterium profundimaris TaxID=1679460 RepID=A0A225NIC3_9RHOB|nr:hypothetical protein [Marinibacterium profundimaris]OWU73360.1 hypothetical protein ATO3_11745 [Marinibacterium profundimaris]
MTRGCILNDLDALEDTPRQIAELGEFRDYSDITELVLEREELNNLAQLMRGAYLRSGWKKRIAMLAPTGPGRIYSRVLGDALNSLATLEARIFDTREAALAFLRDDAPVRSDLRNQTV